MPVALRARRVEVRLLLAALATLLMAGPAAIGAASAGARARQLELLVAHDAASLARTADAVTRSGGRVLATYPIANTLHAQVPAGFSPPSGTAVVPDTVLRVAGTGGVSTASNGVDVRDVADATSDARGDGVTVALVDTGIDDVPELAGRVVGTYDATGGNGTDGYGHGTFMAGLIAGDATGVAPAASLYDVKVAADDGTTSLSRVLDGLQAVANRRRTDPSLRVLNLSLDSGSQLAAGRDPLTVALDALWLAGITVVVPAGNNGPDAGSVSSPGVDPTAITVGALDANGTSARDDDRVAAFSGRGPTPDGVAKPDLVAPGVHTLSLRAPGSVIDTQNPDARVGDDQFLGSGTSMATAVTSGAVADVLSARPGLHPAEVKSLVTATAYSAAGLTDANAAGAGGLDIGAAVSAPVPAVAQTDPGADGPDLRDEHAWGTFAAAWRDGDRDGAAAAWSTLHARTQQWASRAWADAVAAAAVVTDPTDAHGHGASAAGWAAAPDARSWSAADWLARSWSARSWSDLMWAARSWSARSWSARSWSARSWSARSWSSRSWSSRSWSSRSWSAFDWRG